MTLKQASRGFWAKISHLVASWGLPRIIIWNFLQRKTDMSWCFHTTFLELLLLIQPPLEVSKWRLNCRSNCKRAMGLQITPDQGSAVSGSHIKGRCIIQRKNPDSGNLLQHAYIICCLLYCQGDNILGSCSILLHFTSIAFKIQGEGIWEYTPYFTYLHLLLCAHISQGRIEVRGKLVGARFSQPTM